MITNIYNAAASDKDITQSIAGRAFDSGGKKLSLPVIKMKNRELYAKIFAGCKGYIPILRNWQRAQYYASFSDRR